MGATLHAFAAPCGEFVDASSLPRPTLRHSKVFAVFLGLLAFLVGSGLVQRLLGDAASEFQHYGFGVRHVEAGRVLILLFVVVVKNHLRSQYPRWRAQAFVAVCIAGVLLAMVVALPTWEYHVGLLAVVLLGLELLLGRPPDRATRWVAQSGIVAAALWWWFLFVSSFWYGIGHQFYVGYRTMHVALGGAALIALALHIVHAVRSSRGRVPARDVLPPGASLGKRGALILGVVGFWAVSAGALGLWTSDLFVRDPAVAAVPFPVSYDTSTAGVGRPFSPGPGATFIESKTCSTPHCHDDIYRQWSISSHRYAAVTTPYRRMIGLVYRELGPEGTMFCSKCHAPQLAMLGLADIPGDASLDPYRNSGITCQYCHSIQEPGPVNGNGDFLLEVRASHFQGYRPRLSRLAVAAQREFIWNNLSRHRTVFRHRDPEDDEYCVGCHRVEMPKEFVGNRTLVLGDVHTPFMKSRARQEGISCSECHMNLATYWGGTPAHARPDHRMPGTNNAMTRMVEPPFIVEPDLEESELITEEFLAGKYTIPAYEKLYLDLIGHPKYDAYVKYLEGNNKIGVRLAAPGQAAPGSSVDIEVSVVNKTGAHVVPSGPVDLNEYWIEVVAKAADGRPVFSSGAIAPDNRLAPDTVVFGGTPMDCDGRPVEKHRFWKTCSIQNRRIIPPDGESRQAYSFRLPDDVAGPIAVSASFCYRRFNQDIADWFYDGRGTTFPVYRFDTATTSIRVAPVHPP